MIWIAAAALVAVTVAVLAPAALRPKAAPARAEVAVYRAQMRELERDRARGTLPEAEAEAARAEIGRRLLAADREAAPDTRAGPGPLGLGLAAALVAAVGLGTYASIGAPGYADVPLTGRIEAVEAARADRPAQAAVEAGVPDRIDTDDETYPLLQQLKGVLAERPDDREGHAILVRTAAALGDFEAAWRAQDRVIALTDAPTAQDHAVQAELMVLAANGYVSPEAEDALARAGALDRTNGLARYLAGHMYAQQGRPDLAWPIWRRLLADSRPDDPWIAPIRARAEDVSARAGDPTLLAELPQPTGPSEADIAAAATMSPADRMEMIAGMVDGLAARLADEGGPPADWARLVTAYGVLGRSDAAAAVYGEARTVFAADPGALDLLARAAETAGIAP